MSLGANREDDRAYQSSRRQGVPIEKTTGRTNREGANREEDDVRTPIDVRRFAATVQEAVVDPAYYALVGRGGDAGGDAVGSGARRGVAVAMTSVASTVASQFPHNCQIRMQVWRPGGNRLFEGTRRPNSRGDAAAATWIFRGDESPWLRRGYSVETRRGVGPRAPPCRERDRRPTRRLATRPSSGRSSPSTGRAPFTWALPRASRCCSW